VAPMSGSRSPSERRYSREEKAQAVRLVRQLRVELGTERGTIQRVAHQLGDGVASVRSWVPQADIDEGERPGVTSAQAERIRQLEQENKELKRANEILRRASVFFAAELDRPQRRPWRSSTRTRPELGVGPICAALEVAPSTYYAAKHREHQPSARAVRDAVLMSIPVALWIVNRKVYGVHKLWKVARRAGHDVGRDQVARLMAVAGIRGVQRRRGVTTTKRRRGADVARVFRSERPNALWVSDVKCRHRHFTSYADRWTMPMLFAVCRSPEAPQSGRSA